MNYIIQKLNVLFDTCVRPLFLADPRSFHNFWNIKAHSWACLGPLRVSMKKATKDTICYNLPTLFRKVNNNKSKEWRLFLVVEYQRLILNISKCFVEAYLRCLLLCSTVFLILLSESQAFFVKGPLSNPKCFKHTNLLSIRHTFDFYLPLETLTELSYCSIRSHSFTLL